MSKNKILLWAAAALAVAAGLVYWMNRPQDGQEIHVGEVHSDIPSKPGEQVKHELFRLASDDIVSVSIIGTNDEFTIRRDDAGNFTFGRIKEKEAVDQAAVARVMGVLSSFHYEAVLDPLLSEEQTGLANHELVTVRLRNELRYDLKIGVAAEGSMLRPVKVSVSYRPESGNPGEKPGLMAEAEALNKKFSASAFSVPSSTVGKLITTRAALVTIPAPIAPAKENVPES